MIASRDVGPFDLQARLVADLLGADAALVTVIGNGEQHFVGLETGRRRLPRHAPAEHSLCARVVARGGRALVVPDLSDDEAFADNPLRAGLGIGAYLGVPLRTPDGATVGAVCALERSPRDWGDEDVRLLESARDHVERMAGPLLGLARRHPDLAAALRHELGGDLAVVIAGIETALREGLDEQVRDRLLAGSRERAVGLLATFDALMRLDSRAPIAREPITLAQILDTPLLRPDDDRVSLDLDAVGDDVVHVDVEMLRRLLANLVTNALHHTRSDVRIVACAHGDGRTIEVVDEGPGLPTGGEGVFEPFVRGSTDTPGFGLGLALVGRIAARLDLQLEVDTGDGGTRFSVLLPPEVVAPAS